MFIINLFKMLIISTIKVIVLIISTILLGQIMSYIVHFIGVPLGLADVLGGFIVIVPIAILYQLD